MKVALDSTAWDRAAQWVLVPDDLDTDNDQAFSEYMDDHDGHVPIVGVRYDEDLTLDQAMFIAEQYGGGEFDNECAGIVAALCVLRDHIKAVQS